MVQERANSGGWHGDSQSVSVGNTHNRDGEEPDLEAQRPGPGQLRISYFQRDRIAKSAETEQQQDRLDDPEEPVHSHLKLTVVDGEFTVLGSGNMDRASWYTSQELGILFQSRDFAGAMMTAVSEALDHRLETVFEGP
jgi:phosphatidylserine/phosphatidylglycerophosphate/cardiolipin synthase-like enzyme